MNRYILAIDQGTTGTTVLVFDHQGTICGRAYAELPQFYPQAGWVEHDALRIWSDCQRLANEAVAHAGIQAQNLAAIGITSQRETVVMWERESGLPIGKAIVWQDRRTAELCQHWRAEQLEPMLQQKTGLLMDPYFSGTKIKWMLDQDPTLRRRARDGQLLVGTIDSWLIWNLSGGKAHVTDYTNASRTLLFNIQQLTWDDELLQLFDVPPPMLPTVGPSSGQSAVTAPHVFTDGSQIPLAGIAGDQQSALFGQACFEVGAVKNTYGTGSFLLMNTGTKLVHSSQRLLTTIAWRIGDEPVEYALEGAVFVCGAAVQWLRDGLGIIEAAADSESLARSLSGNEGVYFVPALTGLGAPYWDPYARGTLLGLTRGTTRAHVARAALEAICYQTRDVVQAMSRDAGLPPAGLRADGGAVVNRFLMQFQADMLGVPVRVPTVSETTALGAAYLAGLGVGFWENRPQIADKWSEAACFQPQMAIDQRETLYRRWLEAVARSRDWARDLPAQLPQD